MLFVVCCCCLCLLFVVVVVVVGVVFVVVGGGGGVGVVVVDVDTVVRYCCYKVIVCFVHSFIDCLSSNSSCRATASVTQT